MFTIDKSISYQQGNNFTIKADLGCYIKYIFRCTKFWLL